MPKISVIITAYQDRGFMDEVIQSAMNQTFKDYEIIIASDGNADIKKYADKYGLKFVLNSKQNHSALINEALKECSGEWFKVIDDDDLISDNSLTDLWEGKGDADLVYGNAMNFSGMDKQLYKSGDNLTLKSFLPIGTNTVHWVTVMKKKSAVLAVGGFDVNVNYANDYDLYLNLFTHGYKFKYIDKTIGWYRLHPFQMSKLNTYYICDEREYLKKKYKDFIK
jgi:glycosyltransferase involved in cell wall biosynthesis